MYLAHDLLTVRLDPSEGKELSLEQHRILGQVDLHVLVKFLAPFHFH
jgi:hypothetical protein